METNKRIFVIMPFVKANDRNQSDLDHFFEKTLKETIESEDSLQYKYIVTRSGDSFDIPTQITRELYSADIVICDLSGHETPNPNVMFELGIRFSISAKPVILIREDNERNERIFDISWLHTYIYKITQLSKLNTYIVDRLKTYEINPSDYKSPVHNSLGSEFSLRKEIEKIEVKSIISSAAYSLQAMREELFNQIILYLERVNFQLPDKVDDSESLDEFWMENIDELEKLQWKDFIFKCRPPSAFESILASLPFNQYIPDSIKAEFNSKLMEFYIETFLCPLVGENNFVAIHNEYIRFHKIPSLLSLIGYYIDSDDADTKLKLYELLVKGLK